MKINTSQVQLSGRQHNTLESTKLERLSVKVLEQNADVEAGGNNVNTASINLSMTNKTSEKQSIETESTVRTIEDGETIQQHAGLQLANYVVEKSSELTLSVAQVSQVLSETNGVEINNQNISAARSMDVEVEVLSLLTQESQQGLTFEALGRVTTDDGREINFMLALDFERSSHNEQINKFFGNRNLIDPLMINLKGGAVEFSDLTFEFDLNADGEMDSIAQTASGSGFIVFDKNQNGVIDDGSEMFGPQSGQGFAELSQYDDDGNGWIDENDAIYTELGVMSFTDHGRETQSLMAAEVGAIYLGSTASDYELNTESGFLAGNLKQSGVALSEDGRALLMQEVHLVDYYTDGDRRDSAPEVITEFESDSQNLLRLDSPLNLFQIVDPIIDLRDAQTRVTISSPESAHIEAVFNIELSQVKPETYGLAQQTFDRAQIAEELSNWVANAMVDFEPRSNSKAQVASIDIANTSVEAQTPVFDQALTDMDLDKMKLDSKLGTMRSMIEGLRNMQQLASEANEKVSLYHRIGTFK